LRAARDLGSTSSPTLFGRTRRAAECAPYRLLFRTFNCSSFLRRANPRVEPGTRQQPQAVGLAAGMLSRALGAHRIIGIDVIEERIKLSMDLGLCDEALVAGPENVGQVRAMTNGQGVERAVDCSAHHDARGTAVRATRKWGKMVLLGEGGSMGFDPSPDMIHDQKAIYGSWVTSTWKMEELVERLVRWDIHPADLITHRFSLDDVAEAYAVMSYGKCGKVAVCFDEELEGQI